MNTPCPDPTVLANDPFRCAQLVWARRNSPEAALTSHLRPEPPPTGPWARCVTCSDPAQDPFPGFPNDPPPPNLSR
jgi:hypothetical protein